MSKPYVTPPTTRITIDERPFGWLRRLFAPRRRTMVSDERLTAVVNPCAVGLHLPVTMTVGRQGYVNWLKCARPGCNWTRMQKGRVF